MRPARAEPQLFQEAFLPKAPSSLQKLDNLVRASVQTGEPANLAREGDPIGRGEHRLRGRAEAGGFPHPRPPFGRCPGLTAVVTGRTTCYPVEVSESSQVLIDEPDRDRFRSSHPLPATTDEIVYHRMQIPGRGGHPLFPGTFQEPSTFPWYRRVGGSIHTCCDERDWNHGFELWMSCFVCSSGSGSPKPRCMYVIRLGRPRALSVAKVVDSASSTNRLLSSCPIALAGLRR